MQELLTSFLQQTGLSIEMCHFFSSQKNVIGVTPKECQVIIHSFFPKDSVHCKLWTWKVNVAADVLAFPVHVEILLDAVLEAPH